MLDPLPIELNIHGASFNSKNIAKIRLNSLNFSHFLRIFINYSDIVLLFGKIHIAPTSLDDLQVGKSITRTSFIFLHARLLYHCVTSFSPCRFSGDPGQDVPAIHQGKPEDALLPPEGPPQARAHPEADPLPEDQQAELPGSQNTKQSSLP